MRIKNLIFAAGLLTCSYAAEAQVTKANYKVQFNEKTNLFDCYMVVKAGSAESIRERAQFNAQFTLVVPAGSQVIMAESLMPLQNNQKYESKSASQWFISNFSQSPESDPFRDFVSVVPSLSPSAFYNDLKEGEEVKLFSLKITPIVDCGSNVRLFEKGIDPDSGDRGMDGGDYSNGFTMGSTDQLYSGNEPIKTPKLEVIKDHSTRALKGKLSIDVNLNLDANYAPYSYVWQGPSGFKAYTEDVVILNPSNNNEGNYSFEVVDNRGCKQTTNIEAKVHGQNIGVDESASISANLAERNAEETSSISVYPNPSISFFNLDVKAKNGAVIGLEIIDAKGSVVNSKSYGAKPTNNHVNVAIPVADFVPGMYNVAVSIDGEITTKKLMVIK